MYNHYKIDIFQASIFHIFNFPTILPSHEMSYTWAIINVTHNVKSYKPYKTEIKPTYFLHPDLLNDAKHVYGSPDIFT